MIHNLIDRPRRVGVFHSLFLYTEYFISFNVLADRDAWVFSFSNFVVIRLWRKAVNGIIRIHPLPRDTRSLPREWLESKALNFLRNTKESWLPETRILEHLNLSFWRNLILSFFLSFNSWIKSWRDVYEQTYNGDCITYCTVF